MFFFFFSSRRRHTRWPRDWSSDVCSSDLPKNIELLAELPGEAIVLAVPIRLRQALINLIDNGVKYTPAGGRVTVAAARSFVADGGEMVTVRVTDTGIGIAAGDL